jgi:hypothetical protein
LPECTYTYFSNCQAPFYHQISSFLNEMPCNFLPTVSEVWKIFNLLSIFLRLKLKIVPLLNCICQMPILGEFIWKYNMKYILSKRRLQGILPNDPGKKPVLAVWIHHCTLTAPIKANSRHSPMSLNSVSENSTPRK